MEKLTLDVHSNAKQQATIIAILCILLMSCSGSNNDNTLTKNQPPVFVSSSSYNTLDNVLTTSYKAVATDPDGDHITYKIVGGLDQQHFSIDTTSGIISFTERTEFNAPHDENHNNDYELEISATDDNKATTSLALKITVTGKNVYLRIPVVVHVLYQESSTDESNISEEKIRSQISVLNNDFRKKNTDLDFVPKEFTLLIADMDIEFEMATVDPKGNITNGITRGLDSTNGQYGDVPFTEKGGRDAWPAEHYLNIWIIDGANRHGDIRVAGRGQLPGGNPLTDGLIIAYQAYGTVAPLATKQYLHLGRTATHEIGHWLGLRHIDGGYSCDSDDGIDDTPLTNTGFSLRPTYPMYSCGSSDMFMNFMTPSVADDKLLMFTHGQKAYMQTVFSEDETRNALFTNLWL